MSQESSIEWTDATWNPVRGCVKVSPGCANCYAETFAERWRGVKGHPYEQGFDLRLVPEKLMEPLKWKEPRRIFVNSMSDLFQEGVPLQFITDVFGVMALAHWHTFQVLTKRADRMYAYVSAGDHGILRQFMLLQQNGGTSTRQVFRALDRKRRENVEWKWPLPNVWLGVSVENQHFADERIPLLLQTPAAVRFLSCEPLLEGIDIGKHRPGALGLHWCIVGGESGPGARPCQTWWIKNLVGQCRDADVAVFVKQLGSKPLVPAGRQTHWDYRFIKRAEDKRFTDHDAERWLMHPVDKKGGDPSEWPEDLRVREFPAGN